MDEMRRRIHRGDRDREINEIIQVGIDYLSLVLLLLIAQAMCDIAKDRAQKLSKI